MLCIYMYHKCISYVHIMKKYADMENKTYLVQRQALLSGTPVWSEVCQKPLRLPRPYNTEITEQANCNSLPFWWRCDMASTWVQSGKYYQYALGYDWTFVEHDSHTILDSAVIIPCDIMSNAVRIVYHFKRHEINRILQLLAWAIGENMLYNFMYFKSFQEGTRGELLPCEALVTKVDRTRIFVHG